MRRRAVAILMGSAVVCGLGSRLLVVFRGAVLLQL